MPVPSETLFKDTEFHAQRFFAAGRQLFPTFPAQGREWFVKGGSGAVADDDTGGSDVGDGRSWATAKRTMADVFDELSSGDVIYFSGKIKEQLTTPAGVFDVTIIGCGNRPRHADGHTGNNGYSGASWLSPDSATASTPLLKVQQQGWRFVNILFGAGPAATASVLLFRDGGAGDAERDASHAHFVGCRWSAPVIGIQDSGGCFNVMIEDCEFHGATTAAINNVTGAGIGTLLNWVVRNNRLRDNAIGIDLSSSHAVIERNIIGVATTYGIDLDGGSNNAVFGNLLFGSYTTDKSGQKYRAGTTDMWIGNWSADEDEATVTTGITHADPTTD